ncbi:MAG TPA: ARMT1-like domain-containing protein [Thermotogota bacterium]|nr:ARMT1-like domain-containing protein [Thermotogota bacterium]HRW92458.1 ARMT1-like domain-containing protein [Thermotogota bacterium]
MDFFPDCIPCHVLQAQRITRKLHLDHSQSMLFYQQVCKDLSTAPLTITPVEMAALVYDTAEKMFGTSNVFESEKKRSNEIAEKIVLDLQQTLDFAAQPLSFFARVAAAGNLIDLGARDVDFHLVEEEILHKVESMQFAKDRFAHFEQGCSTANQLLYLLDNAGEVVFDRLFLEQIHMRFPRLPLLAATRGRPVINDVSFQDASELGFPEYVALLDSGSPYPGTVLRAVHPAFSHHFEKADLVVSKGQGNFEGLSKEQKPGLFFCLTVKCQTIADFLGLEQGDVIFTDQPFA